jgi:hypothetical protein
MPKYCHYHGMIVCDGHEGGQLQEVVTPKQTCLVSNKIESLQPSRFATLQIKKWITDFNFSFRFSQPDLTLLSASCQVVASSASVPIERDAWMLESRKKCSQDE